MTVGIVANNVVHLIVLIDKSLDNYKYYRYVRDSDEAALLFLNTEDSTWLCLETPEKKMRR